jgi:hypothetical protein
MYQRDILLHDLKENVIDVTFIKANGERRVMRCTLSPKYLPETSDMRHLDEQHKKPENLNTIACWDIQANGWRSFRIDSVEYVEALDGY